MPNPSDESFAEVAARIASQPAHVEVKVRKLQLDLSLKGILGRVQALAEQAHQRGELGRQESQNIQAAAEGLRSALDRIDETTLTRGSRVKKPRE